MDYNLDMETKLSSEAVYCLLYLETNSHFTFTFHFQPESLHKTI